MIVLTTDRMGCSSSVYENPEITQKQANLQPIIKSANGRVVHTNSYKTGSNNSATRPTSRLKRTKVAPLQYTTSNTNAHADGVPNGNTDNGRLSPALSDRTDRTNKSVKRVAFNDEPQLDTGTRTIVTLIRSDGDAISITGSPTDMKRARRKREKNLRKRLLNKMGEAESISERLFLESERLSLTSSMSRATSRTGSPYPVMSNDFHKDDDNATEVSVVDASTPRG